MRVTYLRLSALVLGCTLTLLLLGLVELVMGFLLEDGPNYDRVYSPDLWNELDATGSSRPLPSTAYHVQSVNKHTGTLIYDVTYTTDEYRRRVTPVAFPERRDRHVLIFTCSFAYGEGVQASETLPYVIGALAPRYMPYNYGFHGHSPLEMLAKVESGTLPQEVSQRKGVFLYVYLDDHVRRTIGTMRYTLWGPRPYYEITETGEVVRNGMYETGRPWTTRLYLLLGKSHILRYFKVDIPRHITTDHLVYFVRLLAKTRDVYLQQFPGSEFYVVIYPNQTEFYQELFLGLTLLKIPYLDYRDLFTRGDPSYALQGDGHPTAKAWSLIGRRVVHDLRLE